MGYDIAFNSDKGYYDFNIVNGEIETTQGLDTAVLMSLFVDKRAAQSEVPRPELRRGWAGNLLSDYSNYEIGSKLWLLQQARRDNTTLNLIQTYTYDCLSWMLDDQLASKIEVKAEYIQNKLLLTVIIYKNQSVIFSRAFELWNNTRLVR